MSKHGKWINMGKGVRQRDLYDERGNWIGIEEQAIMTKKRWDSLRKWMKNKGQTIYG